MSEPPSDLPERHARVVLRVLEGDDPQTGRPIFRDYLGEVVRVDETTVTLSRDPARGRPRESVVVDRERIVAAKRVLPRPAWIKRQVGGDAEDFSA